MTEFQYNVTEDDKGLSIKAVSYTHLDVYKRQVMACYPETIQIIANKDITSVEELKGKKVSVGDAGSGVDFNAKQILAAYGMDIEKDIKKNNQGFADSADSLKNGTIDAAFVVAGAPTVAVTELAATYDFNVLEIDAEHAAALLSLRHILTQILYLTVSSPADW